MNATSQYDFTIIVPIYNEKDNMARLEKTLADYLPKAPMKSCVLLINDGSSDGSEQMIEEICHRQPNFFFISSSENH